VFDVAAGWDVCPLSDWLAKWSGVPAGVRVLVTMRHALVSYVGETVVREMVELPAAVAAAAARCQTRRGVFRDPGKEAA
jgi:hypothetical protein